jgi:hypothetical protein
MKPDENFAEYVDLGTQRLQIFAMRSYEHKPIWSIRNMGGNVEVSIKSIDADAVQQLKNMRKAIDGAIKFLNDKPKEIDDAKGNINDESQI